LGGVDTKAGVDG